MSLFGYTGHEVESEVRAIIRWRLIESGLRGGYPTREECKEWAMKFVQHYAKHFPHVPLTELEAQAIGREFIKALSMARGEPTLSGLPSRALQQALAARDAAEEANDDD